MTAHGRSRAAAELTEVLTTSTQPTEVVLASAEWMALQLSEDGFTWSAARNSFERRTDCRLDSIRLESSTWNRTGRLIEFSFANLQTSDDKLLAWRQANPELTVRRGKSVAGIVCASSFFDLSKQAKVVITDVDGRIAVVDGACEIARAVALPWFRSLESVATIPEATLRPTGFSQDILEYFVSHGSLGEARELIGRVNAIGPSYQQAFQEGRRLAHSGQQPRWHTAPALGWSSAVLGLDEPGH